MALLDEAGFTSVVATNCDQHYERPLVPGDHLEVTSVIDSISGEKQTGLGLGHFITNRLEYRDQRGELVATMKFRILKFKPGTGTTKPAATPPRANGRGCIGQPPRGRCVPGRPSRRTTRSSSRGPSSTSC